MNAENIARILLETEAVRLSLQPYFVFASGIKSPIYCDNRYLLGFPEARETIIQSFCRLPMIQEAEIIAGTSTAGIAWAAIIADHLKKPMTYVRSEAKNHGAGKIIEGADVENKTTVIIEDLISTGGSSKKVLDNLLSAKAKVIGITAIFSYEFPESKTVFGEIPCTSLSNFSTLINLAEKTNILSAQDCSTARTWNQSPKTWII